MSQATLQDTRVLGFDPLVPPALLRHEIVSSEVSRQTVTAARQGAAKIISGEDDRVLVVVGPCSIHDATQALDYARRLHSKLADWPNLLVVMRAYFEKPRTTVGWKGLINDPDIDGSFQINKGLRLARQLLCDLTELVPVGSELLDTISPQFISDLISWGAIGARTTESQLHRELASGVSFGVGFKNSSSGSVDVALDAMHASSHPHVFLGVNEQGLASIVKTAGNQDVHVILRGGSNGPNYSEGHVLAATASILKKQPGRHPAIMIDCSHGNSNKDYRNQPKVVQSICEQLGSGQQAIMGVMIESHINAGRQDVPPEGPAALKPGVSITDACVPWETTVEMLDALNTAVGKRREAVAGAAAAVSK